MAFASGGLTGRGIGNSTMKYNYLPEAHNDYILAIIGEELGFIGTIAFFALFCGLIWSAFKIVLMRWAMMSTAASRVSGTSARRKAASVLKSSAEKLSSNTKSSAGFMRARAIDRRWR